MMLRVSSLNGVGSRLRARDSRGLTLGEVMLSMVVLSLLFAGVQGSFRAISLADSQNCIDSVRAGVSLARDLASTTSREKWGVKVLPGSTVVFKGDSYLQRQISSDRTLEMNPRCQVSGTEEYIFQFGENGQFTSGATTLSLDGFTETFGVNSLGQRY